MKKLSFILLVALVSFAASCDNNNTEDKTSLDLNFKATFGNDPLVLYQDYAAPNGHNFEMRIFNFFISDVKLIKNDDTEVLITESDYVNFNAVTDQAAAEAGISLSFNDIPVGEYKAIEFGIGVSPELNAKDPADFSTANALGNAGNYWTAWNSYIFSRTEGEIDTLPSAAGGEIQFLYHSGVDGMYQSRSFTKSISLAADQANTISFSIDSREFFYKSGAEIDIPALNVSHSGDSQTAAYAIVKDVITNIADAISIQ
jgi:hypothetical protein